MASGWHVIWNLIEGCDEDDLVLPPSAVREGVDGDALAVEWLCLAYSDELLEIVHTAYVKARREGWGSHEAIIQLILHGYSNIAEVLPSTFNRKPQGREIGCFE